HFKLFNDTYGHLEGDSCLTRLGESLSGIAADTMGFAARYGGEELIAVLPDADLAACTDIAERIRRAIAECTITRRSTGE
ncbi:diguanylate cyclase, partial [Bradyrhizobium sp. INPA01-394B]|uniref:diguanylate cyclase domain-containing protein n=1 Tax=Bradyrhizobium campsiandrae TaxID=1729892 RepID=UPI00165F60C0